MLFHNTFAVSLLLLQCFASGQKETNLNDVNPYWEGGTDVPIDTIPWYTFLDIPSPGNNGAGALVAPEYILSAHALFNEELYRYYGEYSKVHVGAFDFGDENGNDRSLNGGQFMESWGIRQIFWNPGYDNTLYKPRQANDLCLIRIDGRSTIPPVDMDLSDISQKYEEPNYVANLQVSGMNEKYGSRLQEFKPAYRQRFTNCTISDANDVKLLDPEELEPYLDSLICTEGDNKGPRRNTGEHGSPLYDIDNNVLVGVFSKGGRKKPQDAVFTRISHQATWIIETICANHGCPKPSFCNEGDDSTCIMDDDQKCGLLGGMCVTDCEKSAGDDYICLTDMCSSIQGAASCMCQVPRRHTDPVCSEKSWRL